MRYQDRDIFCTKIIQTKKMLYTSLRVLLFSQRHLRLRPLLFKFDSSNAATSLGIVMAVNSVIVRTTSIDGAATMPVNGVEVNCSSSSPMWYPMGFNQNSYNTHTKVILNHHKIVTFKTATKQNYTKYSTIAVVVTDKLLRVCALLSGVRREIGAREIVSQLHCVAH